jgi:phosphatidylglycerophosphate synthase
MQTNRLHVPDLLNIAGALTAIRLLIAISFPFFAHNTQLAFALYLIAILTDLGDGAVARHFGYDSHTGAFFDGWVDKILHINAAWSMSLQGLIPLWWMWLWFSRELIQWVMVINVVDDFTSGRVRIQETSIWGRLTAVTLFSAFCASFLGLKTLAFGLTLLTGAGGVAAGVGYIKRHLEDRHRYD